ncbi:jmjC domain-containing histone demethylation protein 1-like isoform X2 [Bacillus rossius redtenbacheri]|uniref:jmjC domain-containing histone demethylation protein 1-like isoform X2 n=1 Tax=Bacillus rossius redtenbacheri TaxID=93214 RepID=UPI002FDD9E3B
MNCNQEKMIFMSDSKDSKNFTNDWAMDGEKIKMQQTFDLEEKIKSDKFTQCFVKEMQGVDFNVSYLQTHGLNMPLLFREKSGLGLRVPSPHFSMNDLRMCVGSQRVLDVVDVNTHRGLEMTMKEWQKYFEDPNKDRLLNVVPLEFSHTKLQNYVEAPTIVREIDWVDSAWPKHLKEAQGMSLNGLDDMMYPQVQKYCIMSVKGCYTDFQICFGGTSMWYHIFKGSQVLWLVPPFELNTQLYERWVLSGKQPDVFFGDTVEKCGRVTLSAGHTLFIPTGWIHACYTRADTVVFGGRFLHSFAVEKQLKVARLEDSIRVPRKMRYPLFTEMLWYVLERYVHSLLGRSHLLESEDVEYAHPVSLGRVHLTPMELHGLKAIVMYLHSLPTAKKNVPMLIKDPIALIKDVRTVVEQHRYDDPELAVTGVPVLRSFYDGDKDRLRVDHHRSGGGRGTLQAGPRQPKGARAGPGKAPAGAMGPRRRRTRCKKCEACVRSDCGDCSYCHDMVKFGGLGRAKQTCVMRQCLQPMLPVTATCEMCDLDGWKQQVAVPIQKNVRDVPSSLMECSVCYEIIHPDCLAKRYPDQDGVLNEDLPNSWECPKCCKEGKNVEYRPRHFRARQKSCDVRNVGSDNNSMTDSKDGIKSEIMDCDAEVDDSFNPASATLQSNIIPVKRPKLEQELSPSEPSNCDERTASPPNVGNGLEDAAVNNGMGGGAEPRKLALRTQLAQQLVGNSSKLLKKPSYVVRPAPAVSRCGGAMVHTYWRGVKVPATGDLALERDCVLPVFQRLGAAELARCALVCRAWARISVDPSLWRRMDLSHKTVTAAHLAGIVRRQPDTLVLDWSSVTGRQLGWLGGRLPQLRELSLQGCAGSSVGALKTCACPPLSSLDLSFVSGLNDASLREVLSPPPDSRPGLVDGKSRLRSLTTLRLAGCDVSDISLRYVTQHLPLLAALDVSSCCRITDAGVAQLATPPAPTMDTLRVLDLSSCRLLTDASLEHLARCDGLARLDLRHTPNVTAAAIAKFAVQSRHDLKVMDGKLIAKRPAS